MNLRSLVATAIRTHLLTNTELVGLLTDPTTGDVKIYLGIAPGDVSAPYILMNHTYGGRKYRTPRPEFDVLWQITAQTDEDQPLAERISSLIFDSLDDAHLTFEDDYAADQAVTFSGDIAMNDESQGVQHWQVGGYWRIRASKNIS